MIPHDWHEWLVETLRAETEITPTGLMRTFSVAEARDAGATVDELADFIIQAFRTYSLAAHRIQLAHAMFYAWFDELVGQLRFSISSARSPNDLPFGCILEASEDPRSVASTALSSPYLDGIPSSELEEIEWVDPDTDNEPFRLVIFARTVVRGA